MFFLLFIYSFRILINTNLLKNDNSEITSLIDDCYYYEYEEESFTLYSDGSWEYEYYFESGIYCD